MTNTVATDSARVLTVHQTDGSNGHNPDTWEWRIGEQGLCSDFSGGWPSRAAAAEAGRKRLAEMRAEGHTVRDATRSFA